MHKNPYKQFLGRAIRPGRKPKEPTEAQLAELLRDNTRKVADAMKRPPGSRP